MLRTQQEVIRQGYQALIQSLGSVDAVRFIQYFSLGQGDYTAEREQWLGQVSLETVLDELQQISPTDATQYDEVIED